MSRSQERLARRSERIDAAVCSDPLAATPENAPKLRHRAVPQVGLETQPKKGSGRSSEVAPESPSWPYEPMALSALDDAVRVDQSRCARERPGRHDRGEDEQMRSTQARFAAHWRRGGTHPRAPQDHIVSGTDAHAGAQSVDGPDTPFRAIELIEQDKADPSSVRARVVTPTAESELDALLKRVLSEREAASLWPNLPGEPEEPGGRSEPVGPNRWPELPLASSAQPMRKRGQPSWAWHDSVHEMELRRRLDREQEGLSWNG